MKMRKPNLFILLSFFFFFTLPIISGQQTSIGLSFRPNYRWDLNTIKIPFTSSGWSKSYGLQFQHNFSNERWGYRVGLFYINRDRIFTENIIFQDPVVLQATSGKIRFRSVYLSIPIEVIFKPKSRMEIGLGLTPHYYFYSETYLNDHQLFYGTNSDASINIGILSSFDWIMVDQKWFDIKLGAITIWPIKTNSLIAGIQLSSHFKFP